MKTNNTSPGAPLTGPVTKRLARALVFLLTQAIVLQPAAYAATWSIAQQPLFSINPVFPNVVFMLDDSWSMNDYRLPPPTFFSFNNRWPAAGQCDGPSMAPARGQSRRTTSSRCVPASTIRWRTTRRSPIRRGTTTTSRRRPRERAPTPPRTSRMPTSAAPVVWRRPAASPNEICGSAASPMQLQLRRVTGRRHRAAAWAAPAEPTSPAHLPATDGHGAPSMCAGRSRSRIRQDYRDLCAAAG